MPLSGDPFPRPHRRGQGTMDDAVEASAQRVRDHLRRPFPGGRNLLMETAGNTVSEIVPGSVGICFDGLVERDVVHSEIGVPSGDATRNVEPGCRVGVFLAVLDVQSAGRRVSGIETPRISTVVGRFISHLVKPFSDRLVLCLGYSIFGRVRESVDVAADNVRLVSLGVPSRYSEPLGGRWKVRPS